jgi:hypothetical protein
MPPDTNSSVASYFGYTDSYATQDDREAAKLDPFVARPAGDSRPWWERVAEFGLTRAIDAHYGPPETNKTAQSGTFAGQNGRTYSMAPGKYQTMPMNGQSMNMLLPLMAVAAVAFLLLKK